MKKTLLLLCTIVFTRSTIEAQFTRYIVRFKDKGTNPYSLANPSQYLGQRALDRRTRYNITIDSTDLPITPRYIDSVRLAGTVEILTRSKWLNQVAIRTNDAAALAKINSFPFVLSTTGIAARLQPGETPVNKKLDAPVGNTEPVPGTGKPAGIQGYYSYGLSNGQVKLHKGDFLHNHGFRGDGMQLAVIDAGFFHYNTLPTFDSIRINGQIKETWDFVANEASVSEDYLHGMQCLSTIAANIPGTFVGTAPKADFYLYRTEDISSEYPIEEQNLAAAAERADSLGIDLCSISLGYNQFDNASLNYTYADMNGNTSISARAADQAARKGMLMVIANGNEGNNSWHYLITPADADSVLAVGAVDTTGQVGGFSSYGPSSDGQVKPGVAAVGWLAVVANSSTGMPSYGNGTSFACPNMAGITTCLWQAFPEISNMGIITALEQAGSKYNNPDDRVGYGIPDAKKAFVILQRKSYTQQVSLINCQAQLQFTAKTDNSMGIVIERKLASENDYTAITTLQNGNAWGLHNFSFTDSPTGAALDGIKYRFKMLISTDTTYYLDSMTLQLVNPCVPSAGNNTVLITQEISQGQVSEYADIRISRTDAARIGIVVRNAVGQQVYKDEFQQVAGTQTYHINLRQVAQSKGTYIVTVYIENRKAVSKKVLRP